MRALIVKAKSLESAQGLHEALSEFHPELLGDDQEGYRVSIELGTYDRQVISVLELLEQYVIDRQDGPARLELDGRSYTLTDN